jgi:hypothetical protein
MGLERVEIIKVFRFGTYEFTNMNTARLSATKQGVVRTGRQEVERVEERLLLQRATVKLSGLQPGVWHGPLWI